jgi:hypothetical protein
MGSVLDSVGLSKNLSENWWELGVRAYLAISGLMKTHQQRGYTMPKHPTTKPAAVDYFKVPRRLWRLTKKHLPAEPKPGRLGGRPKIGNRAVLNGIWYVLWTGCQWKAVRRDWFGVSSSVLHERFQTWQEQGTWNKGVPMLVRF